MPMPMPPSPSMPTTPTPSMLTPPSPLMSTPRPAVDATADTAIPSRPAATAIASLHPHWVSDTLIVSLTPHLKLRLPLRHFAFFVNCDSNSSSLPSMLSWSYPSQVEEVKTWFEERLIARMIVWRVVGLNGTLQVERGNKDGKHDYSVFLYMDDWHIKSFFYPVCGVQEELKNFSIKYFTGKHKGLDISQESIFTDLQLPDDIEWNFIGNLQK
nr:uncharacterized oxidoreductase C26H5.09C [Ipomoea batatas]